MTAFGQSRSDRLTAVEDPHTEVGEEAHYLVTGPVVDDVATARQVAAQVVAEAIRIGERRSQIGRSGPPYLAPGAGIVVQQHARNAGLCKNQGGGGAGRSGADNDDIVIHFDALDGARSATVMPARTAVRHVRTWGMPSTSATH